MLEYYDFFVYVALTGTLTQLFLPSQDRTVAALAGVATFGIAYLARPIGTIIFSPMADRIGRKKTFVITLALMGVATVGIGCLPTYGAVGVAAPSLCWCCVLRKALRSVGSTAQLSSMWSNTHRRTSAACSRASCRARPGSACCSP
nr:MFS transporter [Pandoraea sp. XY-2]